MKFEIKTNINIQELKRPEVVKLLLSRIDFEYAAYDEQFSK